MPSALCGYGTRSRLPDGSGTPSMIVADDAGTWQVTEEFPFNTVDKSEKLARIPTHITFWFGRCQFHADAELYTGP